MKLRITHLLVLTAIALSASQMATAQQTSFAAPSDELPSQSSILADMLKANAYFMRLTPDPSEPTYGGGKRRTSNLWTRAVYYEGLMALQAIHPDPSFFDYTMRWGEAHEWGPRGSVTTHNADNQCCEQVYLDMYRLTQDPRMLTKARLNIDAVVNDPQVHDWWWIDAIQMAMPVYAKMGAITGERKYYDKMWDLYHYTRDVHGTAGMFNAKEGLWWRDETFAAPFATPNGKNCYWSRGNGWVLVALIRVMDETPTTDRHFKQYLRDFRAMCKALKGCQREDGFWNASLADPAHFGGPETTGTSLFVAGMAWGIRHGYLSEKDYLPVVARGWNALHEHALHADTGFLGFVQGTGSDPSAGQPVTYDKVPDFEDYGLGCYLLAGSEVYRLRADRFPAAEVRRHVKN